MDRATSIKNKSFNASNFKLSKMVDSKTIIFMIIGFLLSRSVLIDGIAPLGLAFFLYICKLDKYKVPVFLLLMVESQIVLAEPYSPVYERFEYP